VSSGLKRNWTRSLYWRIGAGFVVFLAVTLALQAALFVWLAGVTEGGMPERMGRDFAELVAAELEGALARDPALDLDAYAQKRVAELHRPAAVVFPDGHVVAPPGTELPPMMPRRFFGPGPGFGQGARAGRGGPPRPGPQGPGGQMEPPFGPLAPRGGGPPRGFFGRGPFGGPRPVAAAPVRAGGQVVAVVVVPPLTGVGRIVSELGPWLALGFLALVVGAAIAALVIFRPAHARLNAVEEAARRFGEGDLAARAPEIGGDEVTAVARAFNRMAGELAARQAQLVEADRTRRQLLADVSHELMTPLTAIRGYAETLGLSQFAPAGPEGQRAVRVVQEEVERIERLVGDLLDLARFEAGGVSLELEQTPVADLLARVVERHAQAAEEKGVTFAIDPHEPDLTVNADVYRLEQALQNLAANALRHTPRGGTVRLRAERATGAVKLDVIDTGAGIPAEHLPHVFDRFYKADQSRSQAGSGLGLSIARAIVERHGGTVSARSAPGVETVFEIVLPSADGKVEA
jgi:two-component system sensor histidine kinase BaeS